MDTLTYVLSYSMCNSMAGEFVNHIREQIEPSIDYEYDL